VGIRCDQYIGLNEWAREFIKDAEIWYIDSTIRTFYPSGEYQELASEVQRGKEYSHIEGAWANYVAPLYEYEIKGKIYRECIQAEHWSSGPMYFIALKDSESRWVKESLWSDKEMSE
jgi:hypothetical protein